MTSVDKEAASEVLLRVATPSEVERRDDALLDGALDAAELSATKAALAALGAAGPNARADLESPDLKSRIAVSIGRTGRYGKYADRLARLFDLPLEAAAALARRIEDPAEFRPFFVDGVAMLPVRPGPAFEGAVAGIGRLRPGAHFPHHEHVGDETTLVLEGGFRNDDGSELWRGDELWKPAGSSHDFVVLDGEDCLAAVLALGGVSFR